MNFLRISIAILAVWRITHLLQKEDGPFDFIAHCRNLLRRTSLAGLADCFYCLSLWLAAPVALILGSTWADRLILWPALSGAAIYINRLVESFPSPPSYHEEPIQEEKSQCFAAEMEGSMQPGIARFTPVQSEYTILSCGPPYFGTQAERG